jgi:hypothetical protein
LGNIKASPGNVYGMSISNLVAATTYIQFVNSTTLSVVTSGTWYVVVPSSGTLTIPPGAMAMANFTTGISVCATTTAGGTSAPTTFPVMTIFYI